MQPLISVIIPVYNVEKYLEKCVESVRKQSYSNLEILLVDDGSTDQSAQLCDQLATRDSRIAVLHKHNGGVSDARNVGQNAAKGSLILFIDPDDYIHEEMIQSLYEQLVREDADVSSCNVMNVYISGETPQCSDGELQFTFNQEQFLKEYLVGKVVPGSICNKLIKKEIAQQLMFPIGKIYEDAFYHYQLVQVAQKFVVNTKPHYYYYHREQSLTTSPYRERDLIYIEIYRKFYNLVAEKYPKLTEEAFFRLSYAYFYVFDKLLHIDNYQHLSEYEEIYRYLKKNAIKISRNPNFQKSRRIAALVLKIHVALYRKLMLMNEEKNKKIHS